MAEFSGSFWRSLAEETGCSVPISLEEEFRLVEKSSGGWNGLLDFIQQQPIGGSTEISESAENQALLRSPSHLLWDSSRVVLSAIDPPVFINATHVTLPQVDRHYVLTQSPLLSTMSHFWGMVWQLRVQSVLMMSLFNEKVSSADSAANQIHSYLPFGAENGDTEVKEYGDFEITYEARESFPSFDLTLLKITQKSTELSRSIRHYGFKSWTMDTENTPSYSSRSDDLLYFIFQLYSRGVYETPPLPMDPSPPVLVHCSDGLGRSGALVLIEYCLQVVKRTNSLTAVKIPELAHELREQRRGVITAGDQLKTVYTCLLSGASKLLSHKSAVPLLLTTMESRDSDDESVDLETQQPQDMDSSGDDFEIIPKPPLSSTEVGQDLGGGQQMSSIESSSEVSLEPEPEPEPEPFDSASLLETPYTDTPGLDIVVTSPGETNIPSQTNIDSIIPSDVPLIPSDVPLIPSDVPLIPSDVPLIPETVTPSGHLTAPPAEPSIDTSCDTEIPDEATEVSAEESVPIQSHVPGGERAPLLSEKFYSIALEPTPEPMQEQMQEPTQEPVEEPTQELIQEPVPEPMREPVPEPEVQKREEPSSKEPPQIEGVTRRLTATAETNPPPPKETTPHPSPPPVPLAETNEQSLQNMSVFIYLLLPLLFVVVVVLVILYLN